MPPVAAAAGLLVRSVVAYALPPRCPGCGAVTPEDHRFCADCWQSLQFLSGVACVRCGGPMEAGCCGGDVLDGVSAAVAYGPIARALALRLKYGGRPGVARTMGAAMLRLAEPGWLLVPVPLHRWRLWSRGFNQSAFIARDLGRRAGLPVAIDLLRRMRATPKLRGLGAAARARAVRNAFEVAPSDTAAGARILLVDDVCTSGATAEACARALKAAGAVEVRLICWARVLPDVRSEH